MTIHVPKPLAVLLGLLAGGAIAAVVAHEAPDLFRYAKFEGM